MPRAKRVVMIDDDDEDCSFLQLGLDQWRSGLVVSRFVSGDTFIDSQLWQTQDHKFNVILLELILPGEDGLAWLKRFLAHECCQGIPIVMYSGLGIDPELCKRAGAAEYLPKPCSLEELQQVSHQIWTNWLAD